MDLKEYLFRKDIYVTDFAKQIGYTPDYIYLIKEKKKKPSFRFAKAIEEATNGEVTVEELLKEGSGD